METRGPTRCVNVCPWKFEPSPRHFEQRGPRPYAIACWICAAAALQWVALACSPALANDTARAQNGDSSVGDGGKGKSIDEDIEYPDQTQVRYLSGTGIDDAVDWEFRVSEGRNSGVWTTIPVPSNWEFHGFGTFHYGTQTRTTEVGQYRKSFGVPEEWRDKRIFVVFEGSMTDTTVWINGVSAGRTHRGAFYRFKYDITELVTLGTTNVLEATVAKESADASVNAAERQADYWTFGGIFRPVYLEAYPKTFIERFAIDARADGALDVQLFVRHLSEPAQLSVRVFDEHLNPVGEPLTATASAGDERVTLSGKLTGIKPWSAESPSRYRLAAELETNTGRHARRDNFGFRTVQVVPGDGIYVNGSKVRLRGVNRHCFWPESGRALSPALSVADVELLKDMNMNAVRSAHYPADKHFLDAADKLGLFVLDELAGWQWPPYDEAVGRELIEEMVTFNVNHPSIIFWDNGNEGGWNEALDGEFARWDPQARAVLHPWATFSEINTDHYESYASTSSILAGTRIFLPTEFLHGLYDGGAGAGLDDYWAATVASPRGAGGFLWAFADEGVYRADLGGMIDVVGNAAPDGIVGPYRQKEGSFYTVREIWSPVQIAMRELPAAFTGLIEVENLYDFTNLDQVEFKFRLVKFELDAAHPKQSVLVDGSARTGSIPPRSSGTLKLELPSNLALSDALLLEAHDAGGRLIGKWSWMIRSPSELRARVVTTKLGSPPVLDETDTSVTVTAADRSYTFSKTGATTGQLTQVRAEGTEFALGNGPTLSVGTATPQSFSAAPDGDDHVITTNYVGDLKQVVWRVQSNGWLSLGYRYALSGEYDFFGVDFELPETRVQGVEWLGKGPHRVWKNRMKGTWHDVWQRDKNDAITGQRWDYPEFKGYFADVYWTRIATQDGPIHIAVDAKGMFLRLYTPANGVAPQSATATFPSKDISFLHGIAPIGDKFSKPESMGPQGQRHAVNNSFEATLYFYFGSLP